MKLLLDTQIFLWYVTGHGRLSVSARDAIRSPSNVVLLSVVSVWEAVIKHGLGKLSLPRPPAELLPDLREQHRIESLPVAEQDLRVLATLAPVHRDPFDRLLVAQAIHHNCTLVTADAQLRRYPVSLLSD